MDPRRNTLTLIARELPAAPAWVDAVATVDIGESGRLLAVEVEPRVGETVAIELGAMSGSHARSVETPARIALDAAGETVAIEIPRRTASFEITFPSGGQ